MMDRTTRAGAPPRVLLAEDDAAMRDLLLAVLSGEGFAVETCRNGAELVDRLNGLFDPEPSRRDHWDIIVTDYRMPTIDGMEVLYAMARYVGFPPVCLITAFGDRHLHEHARRQGVAAVLDKPFDTRVLLRTIDRIIPSSAARPTMNEPLTE